MDAETHSWLTALDAVVWNHGVLLSEREWHWLASVKHPTAEDNVRIRELHQVLVQREAARVQEARRQAISKARALGLPIDRWRLPPSE
jgi:hypothetical protein